MNASTFFRLTVRAIGMLLIGLHIASPIWFVQSLVSAIRLEEELYTLPNWIVSFFTHFSGFALGVYLTFFADRFIRACVRDAMGRCGTCGHDLRGWSGEKCPSCGAPFASSPIP